MPTYKTTPRTVQAIQYDGRNREEIQTMVMGQALIEPAYRSQELIMHRLPSDNWTMVIHIGDWISTDGQYAGLHSDSSFRHNWELAE